MLSGQEALWLPVENVGSCLTSKNCFFSLLYPACELTPSTRLCASFHASRAERYDLMSCLGFGCRHRLRQMLLLFVYPVTVTHSTAENIHTFTGIHQVMHFMFPGFRLLGNEVVNILGIDHERRVQKGFVSNTGPLRCRSAIRSHVQQLWGTVQMLRTLAGRMTMVKETVTQLDIRQSYGSLPLSKFGPLGI